MDIITEVKKFLIGYLKDKSIQYEQKHPWREGWEFVVLHSYRVEGYVQKILAKEAHKLTTAEIELVRTAALLHDIGRIYERQKHAERGAKIVKDWLDANPNIKEAVSDTERLLYLIGVHSYKEEYDDDYLSRILKDADVLDEIGVMSIMMASNWIDRSNPYFFSLFLKRVEDFEVKFCDKNFRLLYTDTAKAILNKKKSFIKQFTYELKEELYGTEIFGDTKLEDSF